MGPALVSAYNQVMHWLVVLALVSCVGSCGGDKAPAGPGTGSASATGSSSGSAAVAHALDAATDPPLPVALGSDGLPIVCGDWKAAIDKLATCKELPQNARASLLAVYQEASADWGRLPADAKQHLVAVCRAGAASILEGVKATCGW